ncbi:MAG: hypothetical protein LBE31_02760, partial [Deltaproteobacteria bacterium]|nr:hypothetical protein [Deltaproteobacteria bacterium]
MSGPVNRDITWLLGPDGPLAAWPDYELRPGQLSMAQEVTKALQEHSTTVIEAGTGIGKTLAYLLPALLSSKKTMVSTGLKNLQDQIFYKDLDFIRKYFGHDFHVALIKGRENYLCLRKFRYHSRNINLLTEQKHPKAYEAFDGWFKETIDGDLSTLPLAARGLFGPSELTSPSVACHGQKCQYQEDCFLTALRRRAQAADIILVNHHLFISYLAIHGTTDNLGQYLPSCDALIFDEAHLLESIATDHFGYYLRPGELKTLSETMANVFEKYPELRDHSDKIQSLNLIDERLTEMFNGSDQESELYPVNCPDNDELQDLLYSLSKLAAGLRQLLSVLKEDNVNEEVEILKSQLEDLQASAQALAMA